jgi:hypothetical protein
LIYQRPSWIPIIFDKNEVVEGKILMGYCLIEDTKKHLVEFDPEIKVDKAKVPLAMFSIG